MHNVENDQTYIKNLEVLTPQDFQSALDYFLTLCIKGSKILLLELIFHISACFILIVFQ